MEVVGATHGITDTVPLSLTIMVTSLTIMVTEVECLTELMDIIITTMVVVQWLSMAEMQEIQLYMEKDPAEAVTPTI